MSSAPHRIRRLTWLVRVPSEQTAWSCRTSLRDQIASELMPTFQRVFDHFDVDGQVVRLSQLKLRLAVSDTTPGDLAQSLADQLHTAVSDALREGGSPPNAISGVSRNVSPFTTIHHADDNRRSSLIAYIRDGRLPWSADIPERNATLEWLRAAAESLATDLNALTTELTGDLSARFAAAFRFVQLLSPSTRDRLLREMPSPERRHDGERLGSDDAEDTSEVTRIAQVAIVIAASHPFRVSCEWERIVDTVRALSAGRDWQALVGSIGDLASFDGNPRTVANELADTALSESPSSRRRNDRSPNATTNQSDAAPVAPEADQLAIAQQVGAQATDSPDRERLRESSAQQADDASTIVRPSELARPDLSTRLVATEPPAAVDAFGIVARDAGLILLHPYLGRLLEAVGIAAPNSRTIPAERLPRAAALLHWLVHGRDSLHEFELTLSKVLLGVAPDAPLLVADGLLSVADREEGDALLAAAIQHWSALRSTTASGLRTSFLQRAGLLRGDDQGWRLRMESASYDLLLGQLPWGLTVVKLPWMPRPLFTDWPTP